MYLHENFTLLKFPSSSFDIVDPFAGMTAEMVFSKLFDHFNKVRAASTTKDSNISNNSSSSASGNESSSMNAAVDDDNKNVDSANNDSDVIRGSTDIDVEDNGDCTNSDTANNSSSTASSSTIDDDYDTVLVQFQTQFEQRFFTSVLYSDEKKTWKHIMRIEKKKSISQSCSPIYLLRYIVYLVNRLGAGQTTSTSDEKMEGGIEEKDNQERLTRKRTREEAIDNSVCILKIQKVIDQCLVELGKLFDSVKRKQTT